jgi:hypothetical protein
VPFLYFTKVHIYKNRGRIMTGTKSRHSGRPHR